MANSFSVGFDTLLSYFETASWIIAGALFVTGYLIWRHEKKQYKKKHKGDQEQQAA